MDPTHLVVASGTTDPLTLPAIIRPTSRREPSGGTELKHNQVSEYTMDCNTLLSRYLSKGYVLVPSGLMKAYRTMYHTDASVVTVRNYIVNSIRLNRLTVLTSTTQIELCRKWHDLAIGILDQWNMYGFAIVDCGGDDDSVPFVVPSECVDVLVKFDPLGRSKFVVLASRPDGSQYVSTTTRVFTKHHLTPSTLLRSKLAPVYEDRLKVQELWKLNLEAAMQAARPPLVMQQIRGPVRVDDGDAELATAQDAANAVTRHREEIERRTRQSLADMVNTHYGGRPPPGLLEMVQRTDSTVTWADASSKHVPGTAVVVELPSGQQVAPQTRASAPQDFVHVVALYESTVYNQFGIPRSLVDASGTSGTSLNSARGSSAPAYLMAKRTIAGHITDLETVLTEVYLWTYEPCDGRRATVKYLTDHNYDMFMELYEKGITNAKPLQRYAVSNLGLRTSDMITDASPEQKAQETTGTTKKRTRTDTTKDEERSEEKKRVAKEPDESDVETEDGPKKKKQKQKK